VSDLDRIERAVEVLDHLPAPIVAELHLDADRLRMTGGWLAFGERVAVAPVEGGAVVVLVMGGQVRLGLFRGGVEVKAVTLG
jgi:hypothetical protein